MYRYTQVSPYSRIPKRIDRSYMEAMWREDARRRGDCSAHLWVTVLALLYGTGLRRGELARLGIDAFDRMEGTLRIDGQKPCCPQRPMEPLRLRKRQLAY